MGAGQRQLALKFGFAAGFSDEIGSERIFRKGVQLCRRFAKSGRQRAVRPRAPAIVVDAVWDAAQAATARSHHTVETVAKLASQSPPRSAGSPSSTDRQAGVRL